MIKLDEVDFAPSKWKYALPVVLVFLSAMMVSTVKYPTFKKLDLKATSTFARAMGVALFVGSIFILRGKILYIVMPIVFTAYLVYGFIRPRISRKMRREIEEDDENEEASELPADPTIEHNARSRTHHDCDDDRDCRRLSRLDSSRADQSHDHQRRRAPWFQMGD